MTTETEKPRKNISGVISDLAFKKTRNDAEFVEVSMQMPGMQYPMKCRAFQEDLVARFKNARKGTAIGLLIEEEKGDYQSRPVTYRNILNILPADPGGAPPAPSTAGASTPLPKAEPFSYGGNPPVDRQDQIMLQHAMGVTAQAAGDYFRINGEKFHDTFKDYVEFLATHATWILENVYQRGGYYPEPDPEDPDSPF